MATNTIALLAKAPELDPTEMPSKMANLQSLALKNQADQLGVNQAQQDQTDYQNARQALQANPTGGASYLTALAGAGNVKGYYQGLQAEANVAKIGADAKKANADATKTTTEDLNLRTQRYRDGLNNVTDRDSAAQWVKGMYADPHLGPIIQNELGPEDAAISRIPDPATNPQGFAAWKRGSQMGADKLVELSKPVLGTRDLGNKVESTAADPFTGNVTVTGTANKGQSPDSVATNQTTRRGQDITAQTAKAGQGVELQVAGLNPDGTPAGDVEAMAQSIAAGKLPPLGGMALSKPRGQAIMARVSQINPNYDAGDYAAKNSALKGFADGEQGNTLRSLNVATDHLATLSQLADQLGNTSSPTYNRLANFVATQTGNAAPTNFDAVKGIVAKEVVKAVMSGGGSAGERDELEQLLNNAKSPEQLKGVIAHYTDLMGAQRAGLLDQYQRTTGRTDGEQVFAAHRHGPGTQSDATAGATPRGPLVGTVDSGFRFKGGDPSQPANWERVQ